MLACAKSSCKHHSHLNQQRVTFKLLKIVFVIIFELLIKVPFGSFQQRNRNKTGFVLARNRRTVTRIRHPEKIFQRNNPVFNLTRDFSFFFYKTVTLVDVKAASSPPPPAATAAAVSTIVFSSLGFLLYSFCLPRAVRSQRLRSCCPSHPLVYCPTAALSPESPIHGRWSSMRKTV